MLAGNRASGRRASPILFLLPLTGRRRERKRPQDARSRGWDAKSCRALSDGMKEQLMVSHRREE